MLMSEESRAEEIDGGDQAASGGSAEQGKAQEAVDPATISTGMLYCPMRLSHLAVMRCVEYQRRRGCSCENRATQHEVHLILTRSANDLNDGEDGRVFCVSCGGPKLSRTGLRCLKCKGKKPVLRLVFEEKEL